MNSDKRVKDCKEKMNFWIREHNKEKNPEKLSYTRYNIIVFQEQYMKLLFHRNMVLKHDNFILSGECNFLEKELENIRKGSKRKIRER